MRAYFSFTPAEIVAGERPRAQVQRDIKHKERAREALSKMYRNGQLSEEAILWSIYSISDNNSYLLFNRCVKQLVLAAGSSSVCVC